MGVTCEGYMGRVVVMRGSVMRKSATKESVREKGRQSKSEHVRTCRYERIRGVIVECTRESIDPPRSPSRAGPTLDQV